MAETSSGWGIGWTRYRDGDEHSPPVDVTVIADPDPVLERVVDLAVALSPCPLPGDPVAASVLADMVLALHVHMTGGGAPPTEWAGQPDAADDDRPVTDVELPGANGARLTAKGRIAASARVAAASVKTGHRSVPAPARHADRRVCAADGQPWPCETAVLGAAVTAFAPAAMWLDAHRKDLFAALDDAQSYRDPEAAECGECEALNRGHRGEDGGRTVLCVSCGEDDQIRQRWERLATEMRDLP